MSFKKNILYSVLPGLVSDYLKRKGIKEKHAELIQNGLDQALLLGTNSFMATTASLATHAICKHVLHWREDNALQASNIVASTISTAKKLTPIGLLGAGITATTSYAGNKIGFMLRKKIAQKF